MANCVEVTVLSLVLEGAWVLEGVVLEEEALVEEGRELVEEREELAEDAVGAGLPPNEGRLIGGMRGLPEAEGAADLVALAAAPD